MADVNEYGGAYGNPHLEPNQVPQWQAYIGNALGGQRSPEVVREHDVFSAPDTVMGGSRSLVCDALAHLEIGAEEVLPRDQFAAISRTFSSN